MEMTLNEAVTWIKNLFSPDLEANFPEKMEAIRKMLESESTAYILTKHDLIKTAQWLSKYIQKRTRTGDRIPQECVTCIHEQVCEMVWDEKGGTCAFWKPVAENTTTDTSTERSTDGPCPCREQDKNAPDATAQDILNLATAYAVVQKNKNIGNGWKISDSYYEGILDALKKTTEKYCAQLKKDKKETDSEKDRCFETGGRV